MQVNVRLSAGLGNVIGTPRLVLTVAENATVADLVNTVRHQYPLLESKLKIALPFVAGQLVTEAAPLVAGEEVALLLPAAGGVC